MYYRGNMSSIYSRNYVASASELLENLGINVSSLLVVVYVDLFATSNRGGGGGGGRFKYSTIKLVLRKHFFCIIVLLNIGANVEYKQMNVWIFQFTEIAVTTC